MEPRIEIWTTKQTAKVLQLSEGRTRELLERGEIPHARKIGGTWRIYAPSLYRWIDGWAKESGERAIPAADRTSS